MPSTLFGATARGSRGSGRSFDRRQSPQPPPRSGCLADGASNGLKALFGPRRPTLKLAFILALSVIGYATRRKGSSGSQQRPWSKGQFNVRLSSFRRVHILCPARAGDIVSDGHVLAALDDRDLKLEVVRWQSELAQQLQKYDDALGKRDRSAARIATALIDQTRAQLALVEDKLARAKIRAPFAGVVVSGDLS